MHAKPRFAPCEPGLPSRRPTSVLAFGRAMLTRSGRNPLANPGRHPHARVFEPVDPRFDALNQPLGLRREKDSERPWKRTPCPPQPFATARSISSSSAVDRVSNHRIEETPKLCLRPPVRAGTCVVQRCARLNHQVGQSTLLVYVGRRHTGGRDRIPSTGGLLTSQRTEFATTIGVGDREGLTGPFTWLRVWTSWSCWYRISWKPHSTWGQCGQVRPP